MHSEICPVCKGTGKIFDKTNTTAFKTCYGCGGKGWVEIRDDSGWAQPWYPNPNPWPYNPYPLTPWYPPTGPYYYITYTCSNGTGTDK